MFAKNLWVQFCSYHIHSLLEAVQAARSHLESNGISKKRLEEDILAYEDVKGEAREGPNLYTSPKVPTYHSTGKTHRSSCNFDLL
eukprot:3664736-Amphidinium_carterae.1